MKKVIGLLLLFIFLIGCGGREKDDYKFRFYYINGMNTYYDEALDEKKALYRAIIDYKIKHPEEYVFDGFKSKYLKLSYNYNEEPYMELLESFFQKDIDTFDFFLILGGDMPMPPWFKDVYNQFADALMNDSSKIAKLFSDDIKRHVSRYKKDLKNGRKIVLIGYSQGNFFANLEFDYLDSDDVGVVSVATPADRVGDRRSPYTTFYEDMIINTVRFLNPTTLALPPNMHAEHCNGTCHSLIDDYLNPKNKSREKIVRDIANVAKRIDD